MMLFTHVIAAQKPQQVPFGHRVVPRDTLPGITRLKPRLKLTDEVLKTGKVLSRDHPT